MRYLVISDSHGNYPLALQAEERAGDIDAIMHLGDGANDALLLSQTLDTEVKMVAGNCDLGATAPRELIWECEGKRLLLTHGDRYGVKHGMGRLLQRGEEVGADVVLYGHTHIATVTKMSGILFVNPGTLMQSSQRKSFAILEISASDVTAYIQEINTLPIEP